MTDQATHPILLIGGVSGTGKSSAVDAFATVHGVTRALSTDVIRAALRSTVTREQSPALYGESFEVPRDQAAGDDLDATVNVPGFERQCAVVLDGLGLALEQSIAEGWPTIVEGVHLVPTCIDQLPDPVRARAHQLLVVVRDPEQHRAQFASRAEHTRGARGSERYLAHFTQIRALQAWMIGSAESRGVPVVDAADRAAVQQAIRSAWERPADV